MAILSRRTCLNPKQLSALRVHIMRKRLSEKNEAPGTVGTRVEDHTQASTVCKEGDVTSVAVGEKERVSNANGRGKVDVKEEKVRENGEETEEDVAQQLQSLRAKLESLKEEKHKLFQELKKVLHEEDEKKRQKEMEQQKQEQEVAASLSQSDSVFSRSGDPLPSQGGTVKHLWSAMSSGEHPYAPPMKMARMTSPTESHVYVQQQQQQQQAQQQLLYSRNFPEGGYRVTEKYQSYGPRAFGGQQQQQQQGRMTSVGQKMGFRFPSHGGPMEPLSTAVAGGGGGAVMSLPHQPVPHTVPYGQDLHFQQSASMGYAYAGLGPRPSASPYGTGMGGLTSPGPTRPSQFHSPQFQQPLSPVPMPSSKPQQLQAMGFAPHDLTSHEAQHMYPTTVGMEIQGGGMFPNLHPHELSSRPYMTQQPVAGPEFSPTGHFLPYDPRQQRFMGHPTRNLTAVGAKPGLTPPLLQDCGTPIMSPTSPPAADGSSSAMKHSRSMFKKQ